MAEKPASTTEVLSQLSQDVARMERGGKQAMTDRISSGCEAMDACLPGRGYYPGTLVEYLRSTPACGATHLALAAAAQAMQHHGGFLVIVDHAKQFYPPVLATHRIDLTKVILVRPDTAADTIWAIDQSLRNTAVAAVVSELNSLDDRAARRLQLAAQRGGAKHGGGLGLLIRGAAARHAPSWAEVQWLIRPVRGNPTDYTPMQNHFMCQSSRYAGRRLSVQLTRVRGGVPSRQLELRIEQQTGAIVTVDERNRHAGASRAGQGADAMHLASELAHSTRSSRPSAAG